MSLQTAAEKGHLSTTIPIGTPTNAERRWVLGFAVLVGLMTSLPYLLGYARQGAAWRFTGFIFGIEDGNSYVAKMLTGTTGAWLFRTPYTAAPQRGVLMFFPYLLLGKLAAPPGLHEQLIALLQLFRLVAAFLAVLATYDFLAYFLDRVPLRRFGLALSVLGGGLGWLLVLLGRSSWLGSLPLDFYSPETFGFLGIYGVAHLALARALVLWTLLSYLRIAAGPGQPVVTLRQAVKIGVLWLLAGLAQPLAALVIGIVIGLHLSITAIRLVWRGFQNWPVPWKAWRGTSLLVLEAGLLPGAYLLYNLWSVRVDPFLQGWLAQNIIRSPHPLHYLLAYGLLVPYAWVGVPRLLRRDAHKGWFLVGWVLALPILVYLPINLQRRMSEGAWVALVVLALATLDRPNDGQAEVRRFPSLRSWTVSAPLLLAFPSMLILLAGGLAAAFRPGLPAFRPVEEVAIFQFLARQAPPGSVVLSSYVTGNALPAWAPERVVIGHGPESAGLVELIPQVSLFFLPLTLDAERLDLIQRLNVRYVFWGPAERVLGDWDPHRAAYLTQLMRSGEYSLFEVTR